MVENGPKMYEIALLKWFANGFCYSAGSSGQYTSTIF